MQSPLFCIFSNYAKLQTFKIIHFCVNKLVQQSIEFILKHTRLIRDYWCPQTQKFFSCLQTPVSMSSNVMTSHQHELQFNAIHCVQLSISENRSCRSHRCPTDTKNVHIPIADFCFHYGSCSLFPRFCFRQFYRPRITFSAKNTNRSDS